MSFAPTTFNVWVGAKIAPMYRYNNHSASSIALSNVVDFKSEEEVMWMCQESYLAWSLLLQLIVKPSLKGNK
ncbi:hypothetical protein VNO78_26511 [Psophocarpus tetragonolobus]|uniref:Uncharacterized protein n=1 Tax=Psophocarpus tetragonolobus TaxID=3891 RepID=A0AAN9RZS4_PSOTE